MQSLTLQGAIERLKRARQPRDVADRNDICLVMIVRDEAPVIRRCLDSVVNLIDRWVVCDTGSVDDTMSIIEQYFDEHDKPGYLYEKEWVNFGVNKSHLLETAYTQGKAQGARYLMWLDADEVFLTPQGDTPSAATRTALLTQLDHHADTGIFMIMTHNGSQRYKRWNLVRNNQLYRWLQPVHEYLEPTERTRTVFLDMMYLLARKTPGKPSRKAEDARMLREFLQDNPGEPRATFYLAQTLQELGQLDDALKTYNDRLQLGGFIQERFIARLRMARVYRLQDKLDNAIEVLKPALQYFPARLEGLHETMMLQKAKGDWAAAFQTAARANIDQVPQPNFLFYEPAVYDYLFLMEASVVAYYAGEYTTAMKWGQALLTRPYPASLESQIKKNMDFFAEKVQPPQPSCNIVVIDDFLEDPDSVRQFALQQDFNVTGNYPGGRTESFATPEMKARLEDILGRTVTGWASKGYNGAYQLTTKDMTSWIHRDRTDYAGILYLTPDAPVRSGTSFYRHRKLGVEYETPANRAALDADSNDFAKWEKTDTIANRYNRMILFNGRRSHMSDPYFGDNHENGRLFQTFFFNLGPQPLPP